MTDHRLRRKAPLVVAVAVGGAAGSLARYAVATKLPTGDGFPWSTFAVNTVGCLLIGVLMVCVTEVWRPPRYVRPLLGIGLLGGFTTYSTAMLDLQKLGADGQWLLAEAYGAGSLAAGLTCVWLGVVGARSVADRRGSTPRRAGDLGSGQQQDDEV